MISRYYVVLFCLLIFLVNTEVQAFKFRDFTGKQHMLADYKGKWVLVNFWATWCPPCLKEIPDLIALYENRKDVMVIGVAMDEGNAEVVLEFVESMAISYPIVLGNRHIASQMDEISMLPSTYIFDPTGRPAARQLGLITRKSIEEFMRKKRK